jgi:Fic family protein
MTDDETLEQIAEDIKSIKKWSRIKGLESLSRVLERFDDTDLVIYNEADGNTTTTEIGDAADVGNSTVSRRMKEWSNLGIVEKDGRKWKHIAPLRAMGVEVPDLEEDD